MYQYILFSIFFHNISAQKRYIYIIYYNNNSIYLKYVNIYIYIIFLKYFSSEDCLHGAYRVFYANVSKSIKNGGLKTQRKTSTPRCSGDVDLSR